jgi:hypothetical protein
MRTNRQPDAAGPRNAGDVVAGPVGAASLRVPAPSGPAGVDLGALASIDTAGDREAATVPPPTPGAAPHDTPGPTPNRT